MHILTTYCLSKWTRNDPSAFRVSISSILITWKAFSTATYSVYVGYRASDGNWRRRQHKIVKRCEHARQMPDSCLFVSAHLAQLIQLEMLANKRNEKKGHARQRERERESECRWKKVEWDAERGKGEKNVHALFTIKIIDHKFHLCVCSFSSVNLSLYNDVDRTAPPTLANELKSVSILAIYRIGTFVCIECIDDNDWQRKQTEREKREIERDSRFCHSFGFIGWKVYINYFLMTHIISVFYGHMGTLSFHIIFSLPLMRHQIF